jgi:hypothetical protein
METLLTNCFKIDEYVRISLPAMVGMISGGGKEKPLGLGSGAEYNNNNKPAKKKRTEMGKTAALKNPIETGKNTAIKNLAQMENIIQTLSDRTEFEKVAKYHAIAAKEQIIDILTNGQFVVEMLPSNVVITINDIHTKNEYIAIINPFIKEYNRIVREYNRIVREDADQDMDSNDADVLVLDEIVVANDVINQMVSPILANIRKLESLQGEFERLYNALYPFIASIEYNKPFYTSSKSEFELNQILANRLKNLDISDMELIRTSSDVNDLRMIVPKDFDDLYKINNMHLSAAIEYIQTQSNTGHLKSANIPVIKQILFPSEYTVRKGDMANHLRSLSDMREDSGITYTNTFVPPYGPGSEWSLSFYFTNIQLNGLPKIRETLYSALQMFFPNLDTMVPIENEHYQYYDVYKVLYTLEQLSLPTGGSTLHPGTATINDILVILRNRQYVARLISTLGPQLEPLNEIREGVTRSTRWTRFLQYLTTTTGYADENDETTEGMPHLNATVSSMLGLRGGNSNRRKTRRRRPTRSPNKTHRKISRLRLETSSTSNKSNRKKTKRSNRPKKNKTRRKRNY